MTGGCGEESMERDELGDHEVITEGLDITREIVGDM